MGSSRGQKLFGPLGDGRSVEESTLHLLRIPNNGYGIRFSQGVGGYNNHNGHDFDGPSFELRQLDPNVAIPFLDETDGTAIIGRALRMEACSPIVARHTDSATDCEYEVAWVNTYSVRMDHTSTADRAGNAVINRYRAPASRLLRVRVARAILQVRPLPQRPCLVEAAVQKAEHEVILARDDGEVLVRQDGIGRARRTGGVPPSPASRCSG